MSKLSEIAKLKAEIDRLEKALHVTDKSWRALLEENKRLKLVIENFTGE